MLGVQFKMKSQYHGVSIARKAVCLIWKDVAEQAYMDGSECIGNSLYRSAPLAKMSFHFFSMSQSLFSCTVWLFLVCCCFYFDLAQTLLSYICWFFYIIVYVCRISNWKDGLSRIYNSTSLVTGNSETCLTYLNLSII